MSTIKLKRSAVPGKAPGAEDLQLGEIAINTYDGKLYFKRSVDGANSIIDATLSTPISGQDVLALLAPVDGAGSGLDADLLDGANSTFYLDFSNFTNIPDPNITVTLTGGVTGTGNATLTDLANGSISITASVTDGVGSGLDADLLDGQQGSYYLSYTNLTNTPTLYTSSNFETDFASKTTDDVNEGLLNLYYTVSRVNTAIDGRVTKGFVDNLNVDADTLDTFQGAYYLDFPNFTNIPDPNIIVTLTGDVSGTANTTLTNLANGSISIITTVADDSHNHIISNVDGLQTALNGKVDNTIYVSSGAGMTGGGALTANVTIAHADTSAQASINGSNGVVIQDVSLDAFGHVTALGTVNLDSRYLQSETDTLDTVTGRGNTTTNSITVASIQLSSDVKQETNNVTTTSTGATAIYSFNSATYTSGKIIIQVKDNITNQAQISELLVVHDTVTASGTEYGIVYTGASALATFNVVLSAGNVVIQGTSASTNSTTYRVMNTLMLS